MSPLQYGTMKFIRREQPTIEFARAMNQHTLSSLFYREWVTVRRGRICETADGSRELDRYIHAKLAERQVEADLAASVSRYMGRGRVMVMSKRRVA